ncbi:MAG TPA: hypothetical protein VK563_01455 [Puia sp.]|nr:hypothetical protein [Puia sp.]
MKRLILLSAALLFIGMNGHTQQQYAAYAAYHDRGGHTINGNVPLNEISIRAYRHFQKMFAGVSGEYWQKTEDGYIVSFVQHSFRNRAHFDLRGSFLYSEKFYGEKELTGYTGPDVKRKYPDYRIGVVTEITNGVKTFYLLKIENHSSIKTISVVDGKMEVIEDLVNGG